MKLMEYTKSKSKSKIDVCLLTNGQSTGVNSLVQGCASSSILPQPRSRGLTHLGRASAEELPRPQHSLTLTSRSHYRLLVVSSPPTLTFPTGHHHCAHRERKGGGGADGGDTPEPGELTAPKVNALEHSPSPSRASTTRSNRGPDRAQIMPALPSSSLHVASAGSTLQGKC
jgi:hypothetical protein